MFTWKPDSEDGSCWILVEDPYPPIAMVFHNRSIYFQFPAADDLVEERCNMRAAALTTLFHMAQEYG